MSWQIQMRELTAGYRGVPVLRDVTVGIPRGEIVALIGPNGAGKSTLLRSIAGQLKPMAGCVMLEERDLGGVSRGELAKRMAAVFTERTYAELMSCSEVVAGGRYPYTGRFGILSEQDRRIIRESMEITDVLDIADRDYTQISDGQRQRVLLARALCQQPEIILLDEPVTYLDIRYKLEFMSALRRLAKERNMTVVMSLHELELARRFSDRVLCIRDGAAVRCDTPEKVFADGYIRELFGIREQYLGGMPENGLL